MACTTTYLYVLMQFRKEKKFEIRGEVAKLSQQLHKTKDIKNHESNGNSNDIATISKNTK